VRIVDARRSGTASPSVARVKLMAAFAVADPEAFS
jgi:hypothetical protein